MHRFCMMFDRDWCNPEVNCSCVDNLFEIQKWSLDSPREIALAAQFAIACCLTGSLRCAGRRS